MAKRVGPQMQAAIEYVKQHPGCAILPVAQHLHVAARTGRNNGIGYNPVKRAIRDGYIKAERLPGRYSLTVTDRSL